MFHSDINRKQYVIGRGGRQHHVLLVRAVEIKVVK